MGIIIRNELPQDWKRVEEVAREAFWNLYHPGCSEHYVIHVMRTHEDFLPDLTFVIESEGAVIGSIFYTKSRIITTENLEVPTITFGPVSILPGMHRMGLGRRLIEHSIEVAKAQGHRAIMTLGYPYHYEPYGFKGGKAYGISMEDGKYYKGLLVLPLYDGALDGIKGVAKFSDVYDDPEPQVLDTFDRDFPLKSKGIQESQKEYEDAVAMLDE